MSKPFPFIGNLDRAWLVFATACGFVIFKYVLEISPSIMVHELMQTFSLDGFAVGHLAASYFYAYFFMQIPVGILVDRFNTRNILTVAILICCLGAFVFAKADTFSMAVIGRVIIGIGGAFSMVGTLKLVTLWFQRKDFALVSSLMMTAAMFGAVVGQAPLAKFVDTFHWRTSMLALSGVGVLLACVFWLVVKARPRSAALQKTQDVADLGDEGDKGDSLGIWQLLLGVMKNRQSWFISIYSGLAFAPITAFAGLWGTPFLMESYQLDKTTVAGVISLVFIGFAVGAPVSGLLSSRMGKYQISLRKIMFVGTSIELLAMVLIIYSTGLSLWALSFLMLAFGFSTGFFFVSFAYMQFINKTQASGTAVGFMNMFNALFGALCDPLIGHLLDLGWGDKVVDGVRYFSVADYRLALVSLPIGLLVALGVLFFIKEKPVDYL